MTSYLAGSLRQRRTGLGWRSMQSLPAPAAEPSLTVLEVHEAFERIAALSGSGSQGARAAATAELFGRATAEEQPWLRGIVTGEVRQGALDSLVQEGLAAAGGVPLGRRAPGGDDGRLDGRRGHRGADRRRGGAGGVRARGRATGAADARVQRDHGRGRDGQGGWRPGSPVAIDTKLDGIRIQVHRRGDDVIVATRSLEDITGRLPEVVAVARALPASDVRARRRGARARRPGPAAPVPGDRVPHRDERGRPPHAVLLRPAPPRRPRPGRLPRLRAARGACRARAGGAPGPPAGDLRRRRGGGVRLAACSTSATRAWSSRTSLRPTTPAAAAPPG